MLDCLINYIGLKACGNDTPDSGQWINSLPGISLTAITATVEDEQITYRGLWNDIQIEAYNQFYIDFLNELNKCYNLRPYCDYSAIICDNLTVITTPWKYLLGIYVMTFRLQTPRLNSFTTVDRQQAQDWITKYEPAYQNALNQAALLLKLDHTDCCIQCGGNPKVVTWLP